MTVTIYTGDALAVLRTLPDASVNCVVTSPPYYGLRDYNTASWDGGDPDCDHRVGNQVSDTMRPGAIVAGVRPGNNNHLCGKCGAIPIDDQIGLEGTPAQYVAALAAVFEQVRRVLRDDGVMFLNIGDSYASAWAVSRRNVIGNGSLENGKRENRPNRLVEGLKEKDLIGIPWRVAFALQDAGWYLRSDIIWHKPNPMPESVTDRPTKSHEYVFLLTKSARYWYDAAAIAEEAVTTGDARHLRTDTKKQNEPLSKDNGSRLRTGTPTGETRNARTVWSIATQPYPGAHYAVMPPALAERCILAGCPEGGTVLDPFGGHGTTALVADRLGRNAILIELNPDHAQAAADRLRNDAPMFADVRMAVAP